MSLSSQLKELGQLARNVEDAAARVSQSPAPGNVSVVVAEMADWVRAATRIISETAIEVHNPDRNLTAPEGVPVAEGVEQEMCTFEDSDCNRCILDAEHVGNCVFDGYRSAGSRR